MSLDQKKQVVPGIPLAALDAVKDENVRQVLKALVDAHQVRNGAAGSGDERFVTAREMGLVKGNTSIGGGSGNYAPPRAGELLAPAAVGRIITDLQAQVVESPLFKLLGEKIDLVDKPGGIFDRVKASETAIINEVAERKTADTAEVTARSALGARVGTTEAGLVTEQTARVNADNALSQSTTTQFTQVRNSVALVQQSITTVSNSVSSVASDVGQVQAALRDDQGRLISSAVVQRQAQAAVSATGEFSARYGIKIDINGYVAGYGLMSTANNSVPFSEFIVRADRFAIGSPSGPGITPQVPFIVTTVGTNVGGEYAPPGVYIQTAVIQNGSIGRAKIGDLAVDTLKIAGNSVTVGTYDSGGGNSVGAGGTTTLINRTVDLGDDYNTGLIIIGVVSLFAMDNATYGLRILVNGRVAGDVRASLQSGFPIVAPTTGFMAGTGRYATIQLQAYNPAGGPGGNVALTVNSSNIAVLGGKR
jgi:hypothetical protein